MEIKEFILRSSITSIEQAKEDIARALDNLGYKSREGEDIFISIDEVISELTHEAETLYGKREL